MEKKFNENIQVSDIPVEAFKFDAASLVTFAEGGEGDERNNIRLKLYDGSIVNHWYWGNMAFDIKGMKLAKPKISILYSHDRDNRIGYSTKAKFEDDFVLDGKMLKGSEQAQRIRSDYDDGFPFEASLSFDPGDVTLQYVKEGETVEVNGKQLKGPGTVLLKTKIKEASICVFGLQKNTKTTIFGLEEGEKAIREQFAKFAETFADDPAFCIEQFKAGRTLEEALVTQNEQLKIKEKQPAAEADANKTKIDPAIQEFSDIQQPPGGEKPTDFEAAVKQHLEKEKCSEADAIRFCVGKFPTLYDEYQKKLKESL